MKTGKLIVFEGMDGTGKTTQTALAHEYLRQRDIQSIIVRFPGQTVPLGTTVRGLLANEFKNIPPRAMTLLFAADAAATVDNVIVPALSSGMWVICDRWWHSADVYNEVFNRFDVETLFKINEYVFSAVQRAHTTDFVLMLNPASARMRATVRQHVVHGTSDTIREYDGMPITVYEKLSESYLEAARYHGSYIVRQDPADSPETIFDKHIKSEIDRMIGGE